MKPLTTNRGLPFVARSPNLDLKVSNDFHVQSANQMVGFTSASEYSDLVDHIIGEVHSSTVDHYGIIVQSANQMVGFTSASEYSDLVDTIPSLEKFIPQLYTIIV